ncbi:two-component system OmpR family response regulator [Lipingzhangella halophila]|uniref:Two-component system OmpR family response regulator n=1 Tax=Lipingzhangella halophila TaxID=1783352 RepID=A0A7W7RG11_9ACTN|nr:response regulator transcription factor [Lipingzhangella halophila]MBB4931279.1 two-component system OmpR family response regulator [Lipingzhangella halophila]
MIADDGETRAAGFARETAETRGCVLVVEDDPNIRELLTASLELAGYGVCGSRDADAALGALARFTPDIAVVDIMLPGRSGLDLVADLRGVLPGLAVLLLTARGSAEDRVAGLRAGADDYVTKPFSLDEVLLRLQAILRRTGHQAQAEEAHLRYADLELCEDAHEARRGGTPIPLSRTELALLRYLLTNAGRIVSKPQILDRVWGGGADDTRVVETYVSYLRRKIDTGRIPLIHTVWGVGYTLRISAQERR